MKALKSLIRTGLILWFVGVPCLAANPASGVFVHDDAGNLVKVIDSMGVSLEYFYDATGSITQILRTSLSGTAIFGFFPQQAPIGATITIQGQGFAGTPAANDVRFNGAAAVVLSASPSTLVVNVPPGATSGSITVTVGGQTATSSRPFTVVASPVVLTISPTLTTSASAAPVVANVQVTGVNLHGSAFTFLPAFSPPSLMVNSASIDPGGSSATLSVSIAAGTSGSFTVVATNGAGSSSAFPSASNTVSILEAAKDPDGDGLTNAQEIAAGTDPFRADTDSDGFGDGLEVTASSNPLDPHSTPLHYVYAEVSILNNTDPSVASGMLMMQPVSILNLTDPSAASGVYLGAPISILNLTDPSVAAGVYLGAPISVFNFAAPGGYATGPDVSVDNLPNP
jgi:YD repeat-containing protein